MQKFSCKLFLLTILLVFGFVMTAQAEPFMLPADSPIYFQFSNLEQIDTRVDVDGNPLNDITMPGTNPLTNNTYEDDFGTMGNWGVFKISSIQAGAVQDENQLIGGGLNIFSDNEEYIISGIGTIPAHAQGQIHGVFGDIQLTSGTTAEEGFLDLYWSDGTTNPIDETVMDGTAGPSDALVNQFVQGTFLARLNFSYGIIAGDSDTTVSSNINLLGLPDEFDGIANSFADVNLSETGLWTDLLNGNWFIPEGFPNVRRDVRFKNSFDNLSTWDGVDGVVGAASSDPGQVFTAIPEPGTIFLLGAGLLGFAGVLRRK